MDILKCYCSVSINISINIWTISNEWIIIVLKRYTTCENQKKYQNWNLIENIIQYWILHAVQCTQYSVYFKVNIHRLSESSIRHHHATIQQEELLSPNTFQSTYASVEFGARFWFEHHFYRWIFPGFFSVYTPYIRFPTAIKLNNCFCP